MYDKLLRKYNHSKSTSKYQQIAIIFKTNIPTQKKSTLHDNKTFPLITPHERNSMKNIFDEASNPIACPHNWRPITQPPWRPGPSLTWMGLQSPFPDPKHERGSRNIPGFWVYPETGLIRTWAIAALCRDLNRSLMWNHGEILSWMVHANVGGWNW